MNSADEAPIIDEELDLAAIACEGMFWLLIDGILPQEETDV